MSMYKYEITKKQTKSEAGIVDLKKSKSPIMVMVVKNLQDHLYMKD